jgi:hypothetical protein
MSKILSKQITHDQRRNFPQIYGLKPGPVIIQPLPEIKYVSQEMTTFFDTNWIAHPHPIDEQWIAWKVVNQLKQITKKNLNYKFKLMPHEIVWNNQVDSKQWSVSYMMQVPQCITHEIFEEARTRVEKRLRGCVFPTIQLISKQHRTCALKLHVGHYKDTIFTLEEISRTISEQGYRISGSPREIYLTPSMGCYPPETWKTVIVVELENCHE